MSYEPELLGPAATPYLQESCSLVDRDSTSGERENRNVDKEDIESSEVQTWSPIAQHVCTFGPDIFQEVMLNFITNPNLNSSWLFRADVSSDITLPSCPPLDARWVTFHGFRLTRMLVRTMIPRNLQRDNPLEQTCAFYQNIPQTLSEAASETNTPTPDDSNSDENETLETYVAVYLPHANHATELPFYHPPVRGIAHILQWDPTTNSGTISIHYSYFRDETLLDQDQKTRSERTALMLLKHLWKHGHGQAGGYVKRVQHDLIIPQSTLQDQYAYLKEKFARRLITTWAESTNPDKHVFEDLCIASFLIELWKDMYTANGQPFPGFVDIGCGNGLLVYILRQEGYAGWGFDVRSRKSWATYNEQYVDETGQLVDSLREHILVPTFVRTSSSHPFLTSTPASALHNGQFPAGTFIISNHADQLTPWTPILAAASDCSFLSIPCCSYDLSGNKYRAPPPRDNPLMKSAYASLVDWVRGIAEDCRFHIESEMLRIPSTRNSGLLGRKRVEPTDQIDLQAIIRAKGGCSSFLDNAGKLTSQKGH